MTQSRALLEMGDELQRFVTGLDVPQNMTLHPNLGASVTISIDDTVAPGGTNTNPDVVFFWGKVALEVAKLVGAGLAAGIGAKLAGGTDCMTTTTTETTQNSDGSTTTKTVETKKCK